MHTQPLKTSSNSEQAIDSALQTGFEDRIPKPLSFHMHKKIQTS